MIVAHAGAAAVLVLLVAGCATQEHRMAADRMAADDAQCRSDGVASGSQAYVDCRLELEQMRKAGEATTNSAGGLPGAIQFAVSGQR